MWSNAIPYSAAGVVLRAFFNGTEAAVKRPKAKFTLSARDLKMFSKEVQTMLKASITLERLNLVVPSFLTACPGQPPSLCAAIRCEFESVRPLHRHGVDGGRQLVRRAGRGAPPARIPAHQGCA